MRVRYGDGDPLARILLPLAKLRCTRGGIRSASLALEVFGGNGYIEDWPMARQLRDAQCHTIWEGTENILALDVLRTMARDRAHEPLLAMIDGAAGGATHPLLRPVRELVDRARGQLVESMAQVAGASERAARLRAGRLANDMADVVQAALLLDHARWQLTEHGSARAAAVAAWFARTHLDPRGRWHPSIEAIALDHFDAVVGYAALAPESLTL